jgi:hypothetical protein
MSTERTRKFIAANPDLPNVIGGTRIDVIEIDGWLRVVLEVGEWATDNDIRTASKHLIDWRDRLIQYQGLWPGWSLPEIEYRSRLEERDKAKHSYANTANNFNRTVANLLEQYCAYRTAGLAPDNPEDLGRWFHEHLPGNPFMLAEVKRMLGIWGLEEKIADEAVERILNGEPAFEAGYPLEKSKCREAIRTWRQMKEHQKKRGWGKLAGSPHSQHR